MHLCWHSIAERELELNCAHARVCVPVSVPSAMYLIDPLGNATLTPAERARILGGEVCSWDPFQDGTNYLANAFPRAYAIAERLWSPQNTRDVPTPVNWSLYLAAHLI